MRERLVDLLAARPYLRAAPAVIGVVVADWVLLHETGAAGYVKPLVVAGFLLCSVAALNPQAGLALLFLLASIDGLLKGWFGGGILALLMKDYFLGLCVIGWLSSRPLGLRRRPEVARVLWLMGLLAALVTVEVLNPNARLLASLAGARAWLIWLPVFPVAYDSVTAPRAVARYAAWIGAVATLVGIYGLLQFQWGLNFLGALSEESVARADQYAWYGASGGHLRIFGTTVGPHRYAGLMAFGMLLAAGWALQRRGAATKVLVAAAAGVMGCGLVLSGSRTAIVAACIGALAAVLVARNLRLSVGLVALAVVGSLAAGRLTGGSIYERVASVWTKPAYTEQRPFTPFKFALDQATKHPLGLGLDSGVGVPYSMRLSLPRRGHMSENGFARAIVELGWPGLFVYVGLMASVFILALRSAIAARRGEYGLLAAALFGTVVTQLVCAATGPILYPTPEAILFMGCLAFLARLGEPPGEPEPATEPEPVPAAAAPLPLGDGAQI